LFCLTRGVFRGVDGFITLLDIPLLLRTIGGEIDNSVHFKVLDGRVEGKMARASKK